MTNDKAVTYDFSHLDALKKKLDALRPLPADLYQKIMGRFHVDWTYNSNAIEGNTLTLSETRFYLHHGLTSKGKTLSEYLEAKNHKEALGFLEEVVRDKRPLSESLIKQLHSILFERNEKYTIQNELGQKITKDVRRGEYKRENNYVLLPNGTQKFYCDPIKVPNEMHELILFYKENTEKIHPIILATEVHARFVHIHPFVDGNGRTARLIMNLILIQAGYSPAIIQNDSKEEYYEVLQHFDDTGEIEGFVNIVEKETVRSMEIMLNAATGKTIYEKEDIAKRLENFSGSMEKLDKDIGKVSRKVSKEEKGENIKKIRNYLSGIAEKTIGKYKSDLFDITIISPRNLRLLSSYKYFCKQIYNQGIIPSLKLTEKIENKISPIGLNRNLANRFMVSLDDDSPISTSMEIYNLYDDYFDEGSTFSLIVGSKRRYIPSGELSFIVLPTEYHMYVFGTIFIPTLDYHNVEIEEFVSKLNNPLFSSIKNGILWEDWNKEDLNNFFTEVFEQFLNMVEQEAEKRRIQIAEKEGKKNNE